MSNFLDTQVSLAPTPVSLSVRRPFKILSVFHSVSISEPSQSVETTLRWPPWWLTWRCTSVWRWTMWQTTKKIGQHVVPHGGRHEDRQKIGWHGVGHGGRQGGRQAGRHGGWSRVLFNWAQTFSTRTLIPDLLAFIIKKNFHKSSNAAEDSTWYLAKLWFHVKAHKMRVKLLKNTNGSVENYLFAFKTQDAWRCFLFCV